MSTLLVNKIKSYTGNTVTISGSNISVTGNTTLGDNVGTDTITVKGSLTASGDISASGTIYASSFESPGETSISINDSLNITGGITASGHISASGDIYGNEGRFETNVWVGSGEVDDDTSPRLRLHTPAPGAGVFVDYDGGSLNFRYDNANTVYFSTAGDINAKGAITASGDISSSQTVHTNNLLLGGVTVTGHDPGAGSYFPRIGISGSLGVSGSIFPSTDDTYDLGAPGKQWNDLYIDGTAHLDNASITNTTITSASIISFTYAPEGNDTGIRTSAATAHPNGLYSLSGSQIFSSSAWTSGYIMDGAISESKFVFINS